MLLVSINACTGYKPIYSSENIQFTIADYSIGGDTRIAKIIYSKLNNLSKSNQNPEAVGITITIKVSKEKKSTVKDSAGKVLEYKMTLKTDVIAMNYLTNGSILDQSFIESASFKTHDQYSETIKRENKIIDNLINGTYQEILLILSKNI